MSDRIKISQLNTDIPDNNSLIPFFDPTDTTESPQGTTKIATKGDLQGAKGDKGLNWRGNWSNSTPYAQDDAVFYNGSSYVCLTGNTGSQPPSANWDLLAQKGDDTQVATKADKTTTISAGTGLTGGGDLSANRTLALDGTTQTALGKANTALQASDITGKEDKSNKATNLNTPDNTKYPTTKAVSDELATKVAITTFNSHATATNNPHSVTKTQVGLSNVSNDAQVKLSDKDTDVNLTANSDTKVPSQKAIKAYVDGRVLNNLADVDAPAPNGGEVLMWHAGLSKWVPAGNSGGGMNNPMTTAGDLIRGGTAGAAQRLAIGTDGQVLKVVSGVPAWANESGGSGDATSLQGVALDASVGSPTDGKILVYRSAGSDWVLEDKPASSGTPAWGDITGSIASQTDLQSALDAKQATITGGATSIISSNLTANRALLADGSGKVAVSTVTNTELGYVSGVTSAIQTQLNQKVAGPASATTNALVRFDGTTGKLVKDSTATLEDSGNLTIGQLFKINTASGNPEFNFQVGGTIRAKTYFDETAKRLVFQNIHNNNADALYFADPAEFTGSVKVGGKITNVTDPTNAQDAATKSYVDTVVAPRRATAASGNLTPDFNIANQFYRTGLTGAFTLSNPTNMSQGDTIMVEVKDNGTTRTIAYGAGYKVAKGHTLPTTTTVGEVTEFVIRYNGTYFFISSTNYVV